MTDREKLCELIEDGRMCPVDGNPFEEEKCMSCKYREDRDCDITRLADHLIANGVTFAKDTNVPSMWIPVVERLPSRLGLQDDETEYVLVAEFFNITENHYVSICGYDKDGWSEWDSFGNIRPKQITHWMPLPEPPKED